MPFLAVECGLDLIRLLSEVMESFPEWIDPEVVKEYRALGITALFHWQKEVLLDFSLRAPLFSNLLYSAPTSSGKTVVAELIALHNVLQTQKKALFVFPYISVAREKLLGLQVTLEVFLKNYPFFVSAPLVLDSCVLLWTRFAKSLSPKAK